MPVTEPKPVPGVQGSPGNLPEAVAGGLLAGRRVAIPVSMLFFGLAAILALMVITWAAAYRMGIEDERDRLRARLGADLIAAGQAEPESTSTGLAARDPLASPGGGGSTPPPTPTRSTDAGRPAGSSSSAPAGSALVGGMNYLIATTLGRDDAQRAADYLTQSGLPARVAPERFDQGRADRGRWWVVVTAGAVAGAEFRQSAAQRADLERRVRDLGQRWQREFKGPANFAQPMWAKYPG